MIVIKIPSTKCELQIVSLRTETSFFYVAFMMTSSNGIIFRVCAGNSPVPGEFLTQRPVTRGFDVFFDLWLNIRLSKQS